MNGEGGKHAHPQSDRRRRARKELRADATLSVYTSVGHASFREAPERFDRELREFRESL
jgi:pimeloyl-ACP methyl ester carboxylesterase